MATTLASRFTALNELIRSEATAAGRTPGSVRLLAVSKQQTTEAILALYALGQRAFGENYIQEALTKMPLLPADIEWHCIGPVQSNKSRLVAEHFSWCHTVASEKLACRLSEQRPPGLPPLQIGLQLHIGAEASKSGCSADEAFALAERVAALPRLHLRGVMCIPPPSDDPAMQRAYFAEARTVYEQLQARGHALDTLSMGMSADLAAAIAEGSTLVRVGSALFGPRAGKLSPSN